MMRPLNRVRMIIGSVLLISLVPALVRAEVTRVEIARRGEVLGGRTFGSAGSFEYIVGRIHFSVDPQHERNRIVADIDNAPRNASGRVEFSSDLAILRPRDPARGNGVALVDVVNRGRKMVLSGFNQASGSGDLATEQEFGDAFLLEQGYTLVWVGWEFDVPERDGAIRIEVPVASGMLGTVSGNFIPNVSSTSITVTDLQGYLPQDPASTENRLTVRTGLEGLPVVVPRDKWTLSGNVVTVAEGLVPGNIYELSYRASALPIAGLGFVAVRDTAAWVKYVPEATASAKYLYAFGSSQSGRFLRTFLYQGFNADERNRQVFDAVLAHIAGASRIDLNRRGSVPTSLGNYSATGFPFADSRQRDSVTGSEEGLLDNSRARRHQPKVFYTNTGVEYWGGGRVAALVHASPDGSRDFTLQDNIRSYFLAGTQHGPSAFPPSASNGQQMDNPNNYWWSMRALLVAMDKWVREGTMPPASQYPRISDETLVRSSYAAFPDLPGVASPVRLTAGTRAANPLISREGGPGAQLPLLIPQVDSDGNERSGIRLPDLAVPLATYTGWNFRGAAIGAPDHLYPLLGSYIPFARTKAEREKNGDPRLSIEERYASREKYLEMVQAAGTDLVGQGYLLRNDLPAVVKRAADHWDMLAR